MDKIVTGCRDCPFLYESEEAQGDAFQCQYPGNNIRIKSLRYGPITPDDCPLKKESISVSFKQTSEIWIG